MTQTWAVGDKAKLFDYSGRHGDIGRVDYIGNGIVLLDLGDCIWPVDPSDLKPVVTFEEMAAQRDPLYAAMQPIGEFQWALDNHWTSAQWWWSIAERDRLRRVADAALLRLAIRALRNQGEPYYDAR